MGVEAVGELVNRGLERSDTTRIQTFDSGGQKRGVNTTPRRDDNQRQTFTRGKLEHGDGMEKMEGGGRKQGRFKGEERVAADRAWVELGTWELGNLGGGAENNN